MCVYTHTHMCIHTHTHSRVRACTHLRVRAYTHLYSGPAFMVLMIVIVMMIRRSINNSVLLLSPDFRTEILCLMEVGWKIFKWSVGICNFCADRNHLQTYIRALLADSFCVGYAPNHLLNWLPKSF